MKVKNTKKIDFRSQCPISSSLDILGDKWSLLILRDLCFVGKRTFGEFSASEEGIADNILSDRLKKLEAHGLINRRKLPDNKKTIIYSATDKGIDLIPVMVEYILWAEKYLHSHISDEAKNFASALQSDKGQMIAQISSSLRTK